MQAESAFKGSCPIAIVLPSTTWGHPHGDIWLNLQFTNVILLEAAMMLWHRAFLHACNIPLCVWEHFCSEIAAYARWAIYQEKRVYMHAESAFKGSCPIIIVLHSTMRWASMWKDQPNSWLIIIFIIFKRDGCILSVCVCVYVCMCVCFLIRMMYKQVLL
jgi:hypothetical protein